MNTYLTVVMILTDSEYVQVSFSSCEILIQPWRWVCGRRGALESTRCSELTLVCLSNSWQTWCQQPNTEAYTGPRMQFMFALLERAAEGQAVVFEEEIWTLLCWPASVKRVTDNFRDYRGTTMRFWQQK